MARARVGGAMHRWVVLGGLALVLAGCSSPDNAGDADGDTLLDEDERAGWDITTQLSTGARTMHVASDPAKADSDGDGLLDVYEYVLRLDPGERDTDLDGLTDCQEVRHSRTLECESATWDGGTDGGTGTRADLADTDGDGLADGQEVLGVEVTVVPGQPARHVRSDPLKTDTDGDFLIDGLEVNKHRSDPTVADTDGDSCADGLDPIPARKEQYEPGLRNLHLPSNATVRITVWLANARADWPASGAFKASPGNNSLNAPLAAVAAAQCSFRAEHPWVPVDVTVEAEARPGVWTLLDITSRSNPGAAARIWWNVAEDRWAWSEDGQGGRVADVLRWAGKDGTLELRPAVVFP